VLIVADANGDTDDALVVGLLPHERAEVGQRLISGHVIEAVLDEVWLEHPGQQQLGLLAGELFVHGGEHGVRGRVLLGSGVCGKGSRNKSKGNGSRNRSKNEELGERGADAEHGYFAPLPESGGGGGRMGGRALPWRWR